MKASTGRILAVALLAGLLGVLASLAFDGPATDGLRLAVQGATTGPAPAPPPGTPIAARGDPMPALRLPRLDGQLTALPGDYPGRPLLINFWASWCGPCIQEMPELQRYSSQQGDNGVQVIGIALDDAAAVKAFLAQVQVTYPIVLDTAGPGDSSVQLGNRKGLLPYSVLIDADGRLARQKLGPFAHGEIERWVGQWMERAEASHARPAATPGAP